MDYHTCQRDSIRFKQLLCNSPLPNSIQSLHNPLDVIFGSTPSLCPCHGPRHVESIENRCSMGRAYDFDLCVCVFNTTEKTRWMPTQNFTAINEGEEKYEKMADDHGQIFMTEFRSHLFFNRPHDADG